uniref:General transcription factor IIH subunit 4 n=1 Tax=Cyprinus carpio TaxID=7962 RepID=A0A8C2HLA0_CYPCA
MYCKIKCNDNNNKLCIIRRNLKPNPNHIVSTCHVSLSYKCMCLFAFPRDHDQCVSVLTGLRLWHSQHLQGGLQGFVLNPVFKDNLRVALLGGGKPWADEGSNLGPDRHARDVESLDRYAMERWEVILHFMVGSPSAAVSQDLAQLLIQAGLMKSEAGEAPCITSAGFQFLLLDTASQLWYFTLQYLKTAQVSVCGSQITVICTVIKQTKKACLKGLVHPKMKIRP